MYNIIRETYKLDGVEWRAFGILHMIEVTPYAETYLGRIGVEPNTDKLIIHVSTAYRYYKLNRLFFRVYLLR